MEVRKALPYDQKEAGRHQHLTPTTSFCSAQTKCFICGIGNDYFDRTPHGFETHTLQEHNLANYL